MWESLGTYDQIFRGCLIGSLFGITVAVGYWLVARILSPHVKHLEAQLGYRIDKPD